MRSTDGLTAARPARSHYAPRMRSRSSLAGVILASVLASFYAGRARAVTEPPPDPIRLGLYEWMAVAPVVVAANVIGDDGKFVIAIAATPVKGSLKTGAAIEVDLRQTNRDREAGTPALDLVKGKSYLLLLSPSTRGKSEPHPVFALERGIRGAKELPLEGSAATVDAVVRLAALQERKSDELLWSTLPDFLQDTNPVLVDAVLDLYVKFRRESTAMVGVLEPLLEHPRPDFRRRAALLLGRVLARPGSAALPERAEVVSALTGRARRDEDPGVRREATAAIAALPDAGVDETLRRIAQDDPDQDVRFEAEKSVFVRRQGAPPKRSD